MRYGPELTVYEALSLFYHDNGFDPKEAQHNFYRIQLGTVVIYVANPEVRKRVLHMHDLQHILYEVDTTLSGEAEISAIALASRGRKPWVEYLYGLPGIGMGFLVAPGRVLRGLWHGARHPSIYTLKLPADAIWQMSLGEIRDLLKILPRT